ncbi:hypothetical protein ACFZA2_15375 [Microbacterium sp. NPDC007973]|uniref:hypothetical protein n=1 Tax=Microbacterium sp. NPDC007973 TaxID=3364182 RepID=UPI0036E20F9B
MLSQLVVAYDDGRPRVIEEHRESAGSWADFERPAAGRFVPRLGSQDLIRFATFAIAVGLRVERFELADATLRRLDDDLEAFFSTQLVRMLYEQGQTVTLNALDVEFQDLVVTGVKLVDQRLRAATLRRRGVVDGEPDFAIVDLLSAAWEKLHLS